MSADLTRLICSPGIGWMLPVLLAFTGGILFLQWVIEPLAEQLTRRSKGYRQLQSPPPVRDDSRVQFGRAAGESGTGGDFKLPANVIHDCREIVASFGQPAVKGFKREHRGTVADFSRRKP